MAVSTQGIKISDICLIKPPISWKGDPKLEIKIKFTSKAVTDTQSAIGIGDQDNNCMIWKEPFIFAADITDNALLTFTVQSKRVIKNIIVGSCEHPVTDLLEQQGDFGACELDVVGECRLTLNITKLSELDVVSGMVEQASSGLERLPNLEVASQVATVSNSAEQVYNDNVKIWVSFLDTFHAFMKVMDSVSEISIYVQVAWKVLSIIPKTIIAKRNRDKKVKQLWEKLKDIFEYITDVETLCKLTATKSTARSTTHWSTMLSTLVQQTIECAHFLKAYGTESTAKNIVKAIGGSVDDKVQAFNDKLDHLIKVMTDSVNLETGIITLRISGEIIEQREHTLLEDMPYDPDAGFFPKKRCLPGTRQTLVDKILQWINDDSLPQILVLSGQAGVGKSAVAHTIAGTFQKQNRLGSMFCFNRSYPDRRNCLFSTISRDLADSDTLWRKELVRVIDKSAVRKKKDAETQFEELILKPSKNVTTIGSVVVVVDALDESGERNERRDIMKLLLGRWCELPENYRMIVTTRPEQDIELECQNCNVQCIRMGGTDKKETQSDIQVYVSDCLAPISSILDEISEDWRSILAERAEGLFQWAQTVCQFMNPTITRRQLVKKNWETCVSRSSLSLFHLYRQIISTQSESEYSDFIKDFKAVVGAIITAREPLSIYALQNIFDDIDDIKSILTPFGSFFVGVHDLSTPVRPVHTSLFDFFVSTQNGEEINEYYVDTSDQSRMALGCLKVMNRMLCFNMCQLETSHLFNWEVPDFDARVKKVIPSHLSYSCRYWSFHLRFSPVSGELIHEFRKLMDDKLLYYFEAISLLDKTHRSRMVIKTIEDRRSRMVMQVIADWCQETDDGLAADAIDAWKFHNDISKIRSTPHIYLSALPFTPRDSFVSKRYLDRYPGLLTFDIDRPPSRTTELRIGSKLGSQDLKIAFSPKDTCIAVGCAGGEIRLWNYMTGEHLAHLKAGNHVKSLVRDIVYSLDGEVVYCFFGGGDILVWNTETKETKIEEIASYYPCRYRAISSDGRFIIGSTNGEVLVLDRESCQIVKRFGYCYFYGISPNGNWIALHANDRVYIWDTRNQTQHCVMPRHNKPLGELALTESYIAIEQHYNAIEIWDLRAKTKLTEIRSSASIRSVFLSPDDQYLLVASDSAYLIWNVSTGGLISQFYEDDLKCCLGFSHDSKSIALYTRGNTLRVQQWVKSIDPRCNDIRIVHAIWLRGSYLILHYQSILYEYRLQISDVTTMNSIIFEAGLDYDGLVSVAPGEESVHVTYRSRRGLCHWDDKEGEIIVDGSVRSITALLCLDNYLISGHGNTIDIWDSCTKMTRGSINLMCNLESLLPVRGTRFAVIYRDKAEIRDCDSGDHILKKTFTFEWDSGSCCSPIAVSINEKHVICMSKNGVNILDSTGMNVNSFPFSPPESDDYYPDYSEKQFKQSLNGKYTAWIDNREIKLFDVDTETLLVGPSLNQPFKKFWFSVDSKYILTQSSGGKGQPYQLNIWDIQSENMIIETIRYLFSTQAVTLDLSKGRLAVIYTSSTYPLFYQCYVWDLNTYWIMSSGCNAPQLPDDDSDINGTSISSKTETLDYTLMARKQASFPTLSQWDYYDRGWVLGLQGELLFWVPPEMRQRFWLPGVMHMPYRNFTKFNFTNFVHGSDWTRCKSGSN